MSRGASRRASALFVLIGVLGCAPEPLTEIIVVADTDLAVPSEIDAIRFSVTDAAGQLQEALAPLASPALRPVTLGLVARDGEETFEVVVIGEREGIEIMRRTARVELVRGRTLALRIDLWRRCRGELCGAERTCGDDGCRSIDVPSSELVEWTGTPPSSSDAGPTDAGMDAGRALDASTDAALDASSDAAIIDARQLDAPMPLDARVDAPPDAYVAPDAFVPECFTDTECEDEWTCTADACELGRCTHTARDAACDDGISCTSESCDAILGCVYVASDAACDDGLPCTTNTCDRLFGCRAEPIHATCGAGSYCDTTAGCSVAPTFTEIYTSIIAVRCGPCHTTNATRGGMLDLATQPVAYSSLTTSSPATCGGGVNTRIFPGDSRRSLLWRKLAGVDLCGSRMPRMMTALDDASIAQIAHWIEAGALE